MPFLGKKWLHRDRDREDEREHMSHRDVGRRRYAVGRVLSGVVMAAAYLVLVGKPGLVVFRATRIQYPLAEALAHRVEIGANRLIGFGIAEIGEEMRRPANEPVPDVENCVDLVLDHSVGFAQRGDVFVTEEQGGLERREIGGGERRLRKS